MNPEDIAVELKRFDAPDEVRTFAKGRLDQVGPITGATRCEVEHVGMVLSGVGGALREEAMSDRACGDLRVDPDEAWPRVKHDD